MMIHQVRRSRKLPPLLFLLAVIVSGAASLTWLFPKDLLNKQLRIAVVIKSTEPSMEFWQVLSDGVRTAAKEFEVRADIVGPGTESDVNGEIAILEKLIRDKPDAIVMAASDYNRLVPVARQIASAGIKLVTIDSGINSELPQSFIATDNAEAGKKAAQAMVEYAGTDAKVAIISFVQGTATQIDREQGVRSYLQAYPGIRILGTYYSDGMEEKAFETTKTLLTGNRDLKAIVGLNETSTVGAGRAIRQLGLTGKVQLIGFDSSIDEIKLLEEGIMQATVVQKPFNMGYLGVKTAVQELRGERVPKRINTGSVVITKANMYAEQNQKLLFPFVEK
jgi:ribose transport system substrate-binding protein